MNLMAKRGWRNGGIHGNVETDKTGMDNGRQNGKEGTRSGQTDR